MLSQNVSGQEYKLFVGNLPSDVTEQELQGLFSPFGTLTEIHIIGSNRSRSGENSAFVKYLGPVACQNAMSAIHMKAKLRPTCTNYIIVKFAKTNPMQLSDALKLASQSPPLLPGLQYGLVAAAAMKPIQHRPHHLMYPNMLPTDLAPQPQQYPFLLPSPTGLQTPSVHNSPLPSPLASSSLMMFPQQPPPPIQQQQYKNPNNNNHNTSRRGCKLFVGGLPPFVDRDDLICIFCPYGHVLSVHLMQGKSKSGQSCAFVTYQIPGPGIGAIEALSGKYTIDEDLPPISVRFADTDSNNPPPPAEQPAISALQQQLFVKKLRLMQ